MRYKFLLIMFLCSLVGFISLTIVSYFDKSNYGFYFYFIMSLIDSFSIGVSLE